MKKRLLSINKIGLLLIISISLVITLSFDQVVYGKRVKNGENQTNILPTYDSWYESYDNYSIDHLNKTKIPREVKGLYVTGNIAGTSRFDHFIDVLNHSELNSFVIDVKEDRGYLTYKSSVPQVKEISSDRATFIRDIDGVLKKTRENNIYTIARIVTFKDPFFAGSKPEIAMKKKTGGVWRDRKNVSWVDPYKKEVWDYNVAIAKEAAEKGFDEIQFDYVRFPENGAKVDREVHFDNPDNLSKAEVISEFLAYAKEQLKDYPVYISADVFGLTTSVRGDMGIGQQWEFISSTVDYISPMMYPSHYAEGTYGIPLPDANPYGTIRSGLTDAQWKNDKISNKGYHSAIIRPWYQDFTASYMTKFIPYGPKEVLDQINAGKELGVNQYLMWNASNIYTEKAWVK